MGSVRLVTAGLIRRSRSVYYRYIIPDQPAARGRGRSTPPACGTRRKCFDPERGLHFGRTAEPFSISLDSRERPLDDSLMLLLLVLYKTQVTKGTSREMERCRTMETFGNVVDALQNFQQSISYEYGK